MADGCLLYYITDRSLFSGNEGARRSLVLDKIAEAARAGVDYIQLREKDLSARELERLACEAVHRIREIRSKDRDSRTRLLINSRTDVALACGADGVHLRSDDVSATTVRGVWWEAQARGAQRGSGPVVAVSCHTQAAVIQAAVEGADFAVFAPVFEKRDQPNIVPAGVGTLREACRATMAVLALGGVTLHNARSCLDAGAAGIAGIRLFQENRIEETVRRLRAL